MTSGRDFAIGVNRDIWQGHCEAKARAFDIFRASGYQDAAAYSVYLAHYEEMKQCNTRLRRLGAAVPKMELTPRKP